jgi:hypothetical protein
MKLRIPYLFLSSLCAFLVTCKQVETAQEGFDRWSFSWTGGTLFSEPQQVTIKQLHFDTGELFGKDVILEGDVRERGEAGTHLVLTDSEGQMLVVLTQIDDSHRVVDQRDVQSLRVLGRLERGKKGLPYVLAKAITPSSLKPAAQ